MSSPPLETSPHPDLPASAIATATVSGGTLGTYRPLAHLQQDDLLRIIAEDGTSASCGLSTPSPPPSSPAALAFHDRLRKGPQPMGQDGGSPERERFEVETSLDDATDVKTGDTKHHHPHRELSQPHHRRHSVKKHSAVPKDIFEQKNELGPKLVVFMVGLPARGKSYISKKLVRYLAWSGFNTRVFNVGNRRRVMATEKDVPQASSEATSQVTRRSENATATDSDVDFSSDGSGGETSSNTSQSAILHRPIPRILQPLSAGAKHSSLARLMMEKLNPAYHGPVPEPCPSPVVNVPAGGTTHDAKFFDPDNPEAAATRDKLALETLEEVIEWLHRGGGKVAIHDATNSTVRRRKMLFERVRKEKGIKALFIESICTDSKVLEQNIQMKLQGPDYKNMPPEMAMRDFMARTANYEKAYQTISQEEEEEDDLGFIKLVNVGKKVIAHNVHGYLESQCVFYLMQMHIKPRTIWLTRHGESEYNVSGQIGGDPPLTDLGRRYAKALARFMRGFHPPSAVASRSSNEQLKSTERIPRSSSPSADRPADLSTLGDRQLSTSPSHSLPGSASSTIPLSSSATIQQSQPSTATLATPSEPFKRSSSILDDDFGTDRGMSLSIWTSTLRRTFETVEWFDDEEYNIKRIKFLNEIYAGICEDLTYLQIEEIYPDEYRARQKAKLVYRYPGPGGESYVDVIERLRPIIIELERMQTNVMIVTHQVVLRTLLSYFVAVPLDQMPTLSVPLHTLYCLKPKPYGADLIKYRYNPETDWFDEIGNSL